MNYLKNYHRALILDTDDDFVQKQLSMSGWGEVFKQIMIGMAAAVRMPVTKLFGFAASGGSFLGINLHYLPLPLRARLMDALYAAASTQELDETTRLKISYNILQQASKYRFFKPCIKRYLVSHVKSRFFYIEPTEWEMALFLPIDRFVGANKTRVYRDSRDRI